MQALNLLKLNIHKILYVCAFLTYRVKSDLDSDVVTSASSTLMASQKPKLSDISDSQTRPNVVKEDPSLDVGPLMQITVARGETTRLPCIHDNLSKDNKVRLVLWYRNDTTRPFISYDARLNSNESNGSHNSMSMSISHDEESRKMAIRNSLENDGRTLMIVEVVDADQAEYRCTVHYSNSPSITRRLKLVVVDAVQRVQLLDSDGRSVAAHVGPFSEDSKLTLTCKAHFSCQLVDIQWQLEGKPIASKWSQPEEGVAMSSIVLRLNCNHSLATLTCRLICNTTRDGIIEASIVDASTTIIMNYLPKAIIYVPTSSTDTKEKKVDDKSFYNVDEGKQLTFICSVNARPPAYSISWMHNGKVITFDDRRSAKVNTSLLMFPVVKEDAGLYTCIASNSEGDAQSNAINLKVNYTPHCVGEKQRRVVATSNKSVTLECQFAAEPSQMNFSWTFDPPIPTPKPTAKYTPKLQIYTPNPVNEEQSQEEILSKLPKIRYKFDNDNPATTSLLSFVPTSGDHDVVCYAKNIVGITKAPCAFKLQVVEPPEPPSKCEVMSSLDSMLKVSCDSKHLPLHQNFSESSPGISYVLSPEAKISSHLEVWFEKKLVSNLTNERPLWVLKGLPPESKIRLLLYTASQHARSSYVELEATTPRLRALSASSADVPSNSVDMDYEAHLENVPNSVTDGSLKSIFILISCLLTGIFILLPMVFISFFVNRRRRRRRQSHFLTTNEDNSTPGTTVLNILDEAMERNSDEITKKEKSSAT